MKDIEEFNKKRRKKDQFSVTIIGVVVYSLVLIFVMAGTYIGVKSLIKHHEEAAVEKTVEEPAQVIEEEVPEENEQEEESEEVAEDELNEHSIDLSSVCDSNTHYIDYSQTFFTPSKRDISLKWQDKVFSRIENMENPAESLVNTFNYKRIVGYLLDGTKIELNVYTNPETELIEKIRTVSFTGECTEVITYYYNLGNINYIAHYSKVIDTPVNIASAEIQSRYYFSKDEMVKYVYCADDVATEYVVADIGTYSEGTVEQYDYLESQMLNNAYINYNVAKGLTESERIYGYVLDEFNSPLEGAHVTLSRSEDGVVVAETDSDGDGLYNFDIEKDSEVEYIIEITKDTLRGVKVYHIASNFGSGEYNVEPVYLSYEENGQEYNLQILVRDATDMTKALPLASIKYRAGINNTDGEVVNSGTLNEAGAIITPIRAGCYTAEVSLGGYEDAYFTVIVKQDHQAILGYAVPDLADDTYATVLSWDTTPLDLDARAISSNKVRVLRSGNDSIGSTTPEVIYIENIGTDEYEYYVSDYTACVSGDPVSYNMSSSNANVTVYDSEGIVASFHVPLAHGGVVWDVFKIRNKKVIPVNQYYYTIEGGTYWTEK